MLVRTCVRLRLVCGPAPDPRDVQSSHTQIIGEVVIVGLWDEKALRLVRAGSGVIVDKKGVWLLLLATLCWIQVQGEK